MTKSVTLDQFLTPEEIMLAAQMWRGPFTNDSRSFAQKVCDEIIKPNMERIDKALGQENDPMYLAYCVEYVLGQCLHGEKYNTLVNKASALPRCKICGLHSHRTEDCPRQ